VHIPPPQLVSDYTVLSVELGHRAYGLSTERLLPRKYGIFAAPTGCFWGFDKPPPHVEGPLPDQSSWEIERFLNLALTGDPDALECLWSPIVDHRNDIGDGLMALRPYLVSRQVYRTFLRRANGEVDRLAGVHDSADWGRVANMLRLLISAGHFLRNSEPLLRVDAYRDRLLAVAAGDAGWAQVAAWRDKLATDAERAYSATRLPARPDREAADRFLIEVRRRLV
jgi:hypothetical protein